MDMAAAAIDWQMTSPSTRIIELKIDRNAAESHKVRAFLYDSLLGDGGYFYTAEAVNSADLLREKIKRLEASAAELRRLTETPQGTEPVNPN